MSYGFTRNEWNRLSDRLSCDLIYSKQKSNLFHEPWIIATKFGLSSSSDLISSFWEVA